jgi:lipopolysaccharide biosynthesis protein
MTKRLCLFAGYSLRGKIEDYVVYYLKEMSLLADVYYQADCPIPETELQKIKYYVKDFYAYRHKKYDFGSWQELINRLGWDFIKKYDELILCNDSCFAPLFTLKPIFKQATFDRNIDFWGIQENYFKKGNLFHLDSFFMVFKQKVLKSTNFHNFFKNIVEETSVTQVVENYEIPLTGLLAAQNFKYKALLPHKTRTHLYRQWRTFIKNNCPFIKVKTFTNKEKLYKRESLFDCFNFINRKTNYNSILIKNYLTSVGVDFKKFTSFPFFIKSCFYALFRFLEYKIIRISFSQEGRKFILFGISIIDYDKSPTKPIF